MISGQQAFFFSSNLVGRIFFFLLKALQDIFFPLHFSAGFFFPQKKKRVLTLVFNSSWSFVHRQDNK